MSKRPSIKICQGWIPDHREAERVQSVTPGVILGHGHHPRAGKVTLRLAAFLKITTGRIWVITKARSWRIKTADLKRSELPA